MTTGKTAMRLGWIAGAAVLAAVGLAWNQAQAAGPAPAGAASVQSAVAPLTDLSAQRRRPLRLRVYRGLGSSAVRQCRSWYVEEYRPSGTVITPRMQCWWTRG